MTKKHAGFVFGQSFSRWLVCACVYQRKQRRVSVLAHRHSFVSHSVPPRQRFHYEAVSSLYWDIVANADKKAFFFSFCFFSLNSDYGGREQKERRAGGERRSSTSGLKTYVTVGSQRVKQERRPRQRQSVHLVIFKGPVCEIQQHLQVTKHFANKYIPVLYLAVERYAHGKR